MPKPHSPGLRRRAISLAEGGQSRRGVAALLGLGKSTAVLWAKEFRAAGKQAAAVMGGRRRFALPAERDWLLARAAAAPDLTGGRCAPSWPAPRSATMRHGAFCATNGSPSKRSLRAAKRGRPDVARQRERWKRRQRRVDPSRLVFVGKAWAKTNMTRPHGRALRG